MMTQTMAQATTCTQAQTCTFLTYEYRLYPTKEQRAQLAARFTAADAAYNELARLVNAAVEQGAGRAAVEYRIAHYCLTTAAPEDLCAVNAVKKKIRLLLPHLLSGRIDRIKPRRADRCQRTFDYKTVGVSDYHLALPGIGTIAMEQHRMLPADAVIYQATILADCYHAVYKAALHLKVDAAAVQPQPVHYAKVVGIDYAQDGLYVASNGENGGYPAFRQQEKAALLRHYRAAKRFRPGRCRWRKHRRRASRLERHVSNQRKDWQCKCAQQLARQYDAVCVESLHFREMAARQPALKPKACDNACAQFYRRLERVFRAQGKRFVRVGRYFPSSQRCSVCGKQAGKLPAGERRFRCPHCGTIMQRDLNAARNIRDEGIQLLGL